MIHVVSPLRRAGALALLIGFIIGCGSTSAPVEAPPPPVTVAKPELREVTDYDDYEGRIAAVDSVEVRPRVRGHLDKVTFIGGEMVKKGDLLFEIDPRPYKAALDAAEAQKSAAEAALNLANKEYARATSLAKTGAASREEVDVWFAKQGTATGEKLKAIANVEQANLDLGFTKVYAPITGKISPPLVTVGNLVNAGGGETLLTTIVSVDPVYVDFDVDERALLRYRREFRKNEADAKLKADGKEKAPESNKPDDAKPKADADPGSIKALKIPVAVALEGDDGHPHKGVIESADNRVNPNTGTIKVRGLVPNPNGIFDPGMRARVRIPVSDPHKVMLVTERAIGSDQGRKYVYVVNDQDVALRRDVKTGRLIGGMLVIEDGLKASDWVVVNGIQRVRDGLKVTPRRTNP